MAADRRGARRGTTAVRTGTGTAADVLSPRRLALDEQTEQAPGTPGEPAGFGTEASTTSQTHVVLDSYHVPLGRTGRLIEAAMAPPDLGEMSLHVNGTTYGPFTGSLEVNLPFGGAFLPEGATVKITHRSTDGSSVTNIGSVTVKEV